MTHGHGRDTQKSYMAYGDCCSFSYILFLIAIIQYNTRTFWLFFVHAYRKNEGGFQMSSLEQRGEWVCVSIKHAFVQWLCIYIYAHTDTNITTIRKYNMYLCMGLYIQLVLDGTPLDFWGRSCRSSWHSFAMRLLLFGLMVSFFFWIQNKRGECTHNVVIHTREFLEYLPYDN